MIEPFAIPFSLTAWEDLRLRLQRTRWPSEMSDSKWTFGVNREFLMDVCNYWRETFDWKAQVERLSALPHYRFQSGTSKIHFVHVKGKGHAPMPLILTHGWPGSFAEMINMIPLLTDPEAHGLSAMDSFDVIIPSLPGFGFSDLAQPNGTGFFGVAKTWVNLMRALGYERFAAQGGDLGAEVCTALGLRHSQHIIGIHLNYIPGSYRPDVPDGAEIEADERQFLADAAKWFDQNGAYAPGILTALQQLGYKGYLMIEGFGHLKDVNDSPGALWADKSTQPITLAATGASYLRRLLDMES